MAGTISLVIHGGAGPDSEFIGRNLEGYKQGLKRALDKAYNILEQGGASVDAVQQAVMVMEDNPLFNAGKGSELDRKGGVGMCAGIMNGSDMKSGAAAIVKKVKNPASLARAILDHSRETYLGSEAAMEFGKDYGIEFCEDLYFITPHTLEVYEQMQKEKRSHGTVGAVALDVHGNLAACTSTGGLEFKHEGRIGDSSMVGIGLYANRTCAVSTTGDGELLMKHVVAVSSE